MIGSSKKMRDFAQWLIAHERNKSSGTKSPAPFGGVVEKLRRPLSELTGALGFRSLLSRSLALAGGEVRWLRAVHIRSEGLLEYPATMAQLDPNELAHAEVVLIAQLLGLLVTFIGQALTVRLLQEIWPAAPIEDFDFSTTDSK